jgi:uncharacterized protein YqjF (DUF2071 family)
MRGGHPEDMGSGGVFLKAEWRNLAMLNYEVDPALLRKFVPAGTELDRWNGKVFASLVGFRFLNTKVCGIPFPFHRDFEEINLRFYVRRREGDELRRGVVFIKEIVPRWAIATVARIVYNENYVVLPTRHEVQPERVTYEWRTRAGWNKMSLTATGDPALPEQESEEQFITEHFWGYSAQRSGGCIEYRVAHPAWRVWSAQAAKFEGDASELYGEELAAVFGQPLSSVFLAEGSEVTVYRGRAL